MNRARCDMASVSVWMRFFLEGMRILSVLLYPKNKARRKIFSEKIYTFICYKKYPFVINDEFEAKNVPVFIISYNRLQYLKQLIESLERQGISNIHIVDNNSSYPPLLEYLKDLPYTVHYMDKNYGHKVIWDSGVFDEIILNGVYAVTDPDIELNESLPQDFLGQMYRVLGSYPYISKVGFAIKIDDLPNEADYDIIRNWEKKYWDLRLDDDLELYAGDIDTTFALYRPGKLDKNVFYKAVRIAGNFTCRHLPWYGKEEKEENLFYKNTATESASWLNDKERYYNK